MTEKMLINFLSVNQTAEEELQEAIDSPEIDQLAERDDDEGIED